LTTFRISDLVTPIGRPNNVQIGIIIEHSPCPCYDDTHKDGCFKVMWEDGTMGHFDGTLNIIKRIR
jgi:hypothetical protein